MAVFYADSSALVKLVREEAESGALRAYLAGADVVSSELVLTELPRAVHRAGLARCLGCAMAPFETLGEAARILRLDPRRLALTLAPEVAHGR